ncbi:hypothetical protein LCGC14_1142600 [marine sediment metagenome]|uniref:Uncharacterized protein n=1 Tax=marine sediment metagenome TaxID=412755 RepID=A0A0F9MKV6_9ZZZZ
MNVTEQEDREGQVSIARIPMRDSIRMALDELGVPQPGYPAPVVNAIEILHAALEVD